MFSLGFSLLSTLHPAWCYGTKAGVVKSQSPFNLRIGLEAKNQNKTKQKQNHPCFPEQSGFGETAIRLRNIRVLKNRNREIPRFLRESRSRPVPNLGQIPVKGVKAYWIACR